MSTVLFDLDGTLVRSEHVHRRVWQRFFDSWRLDVDDETYARVYMGRRAVDVLAQVPGPWRPADVPGAVEALRAHAHDEAADVAVVPGAVELVRELHAAGHRLAVVTSAGSDWAGQVLDGVLGVGDAVEVLVTAEEVAVGKPSPEGYLLACRRLGVEPEACAAVEDSPSGVRALVAAGVGAVVGVTTTSAAEVLRAAGATVTVPDLRPPASVGALGLA